jgi:CHAT domain-containing protein
MTRTPDEAALFAQLAKLRDEASRKKLLARHKPLWRAEVAERLCEAAVKAIHVDAQDALALAEAAQDVARRVKSRHAIALSLRAKGNALHFQRRFKDAVEHHELAIQGFLSLELSSEVARTLSTSIQPLILLGEYDRALQAAARARAIFEGEGDTLRLARLELNVGNIYHRQDRFEEALACYERGYAGLLPHKNAEGIAVALGNMAMCLIPMNDFALALETYEQARGYCQEHGMPALVSLADYNIAYLYYYRGQYSRAIEALKATREACQKRGDAYRGALCYLDQAEIYLELNLGEDAAEMAEEALASFERLGMGYEAAKAKSFLAIAQGQLGKVFRALELFGQARALFVREQNPVWPALLDLYQALMLFEAGRLPESRRLCQQALAAFSTNALRSKAVLCRLLLARLELRSRDLHAARRESDAAEALFSLKDLPALAFQLHFLRGEIEARSAQPAKAYQAYRAAQAALETLRSSLRGEELKIAFMKNKLAVYESLADLSLRGGGASGMEEAFSYVEQAKSRSLLDLIVRGSLPAAPGPGGKSELVRRVTELREELNWYYHRIEAEQLVPESRSADRLERLQTEVQAHEDELLRVLRELPAAESEQMAHYVPVSLPLAQIREGLPEDTLLVEYFRIGERLIAFLVGRRSLEVVPVALVSRARHLLRLLQFQLSWARPDAGQHRRPAHDSHRAATLAHLQELYQELVAPLAPRLRASHLTIVPHDLLHYVPFHALHDGRRHLIDSYTVSYAPSASISALCQGRSGDPDGKALIMGIPDERAPAILQEVQGVAGKLPKADLFIGASASASVLRERGPNSRFVHIASHGFLRADNPMFSGIRLGGSFLTLYDLYHLRLPAELVTLSACVSGLNVIAAGDEILGLARGLFSAGAASLLLALWDVPDESTAEFMKAFYDSYLRPETSKAAAFAEAVRSVRDRYPHPVQWAPFVLAGKASA